MRVVPLQYLRTLRSLLLTDALEQMGNKLEETFVRETLLASIPGDENKDDIKQSKDEGEGNGGHCDE